MTVSGHRAQGVSFDGIRAQGVGSAGAATNASTVISTSPCGVCSCGDATLEFRV